MLLAIRPYRFDQPPTLVFPTFVRYRSECWNFIKVREVKAWEYVNAFWMKNQPILIFLNFVMVQLVKNVLVHVPEFMYY